MWYAYLVKIIVWTPETIHVGTNTSNVWNVKYVKYIYIYMKIQYWKMWDYKIYKFILSYHDHIRVFIWTKVL